MSEIRGEALVIGLGNPLMGDDGLGLVALDRLRTQWELPATVCLVDGGTWGMNLLPLLEDAEAVVLIDAIDAGRVPGELVLLERDDVPRFLGLKLSPHQIDLREVMALAAFRGKLPERLVVIGLQPERVEMSAELTPAVARHVGKVVTGVVARLGSWGHRLLPRSVTAIA
jgi:hydrogenase maturation protease